jgi:hypothetical protein
MSCLPDHPVEQELRDPAPGQAKGARCAPYGYE